MEDARAVPETDESADFLYGLSGLTSLIIKNHDLFARARTDRLSATDILLMAIDAKDRFTYSHSKRVGARAVALAEAAGLDEPECEEIRLAGLLHDVGKIGLSEAMLTKPTDLTRRERLIFQRHPIMSAEIIDYFGFASAEVAQAVRHHHERVDGQGYPDGFRAGEIPIAARILAIADAWDAMISRRAYRLPYDPDRAINELLKNKNSQFDDMLVDLFVKTIS